MKRVLVLGATSAIAQGFSRAAAARGDKLFLVGRSADRLEAAAADLRVRGAEVATFASDLARTAGHAELLERAEKALGGPIDIALVAHGTLTDQARAQVDIVYFEQEVQTNFVSAASLVAQLANRMEARGQGSIAVISSVAGDRGRQSNYAYGAAKAGLTAYLGGVRQRLAKKGVAVVTVKPGFVDTPMTAHLKKNPLFAQPDVVGKAILRAADAGRDEVYLPWFWFGIMTLVRSVPERVFKRLSM